MNSKGVNVAWQTKEVPAYLASWMRNSMRPRVAAEGTRRTSPPQGWRPQRNSSGVLTTGIRLLLSAAKGGVSFVTDKKSPKNTVPLVRSPVFRRSAFATLRRLKAGLQTGCHAMTQLCAEVWIPRVSA